MEGIGIEFAPAHLQARAENVGAIAVDADFGTIVQGTYVAATIEGAYEDILRAGAVGDEPVIGW